MFTFFHPGTTFPALSITGGECELNCLHCGHHYLTGMEGITDPEALKTRLLALAEDGGIGALISGGSTKDGVVPLGPFIPVLAEIKRETDLVLNVHTGFIEREEAEALAKAGVDIVSLDVVGARETIQKIYGLNRGPGDYRLTINRLKEAGIPNIVPHITVGLHKGMLYGEYNAIRIISQACKPEAIVINVMIPTKGTSLSNAPVISNKNVCAIIEYAATLIDAPVYLGCMRPKGDSSLEMEAEDVGISGIVLPTKEGRKEIERRRETTDRKSCCAVVPAFPGSK
jgi:lipoyl synthase